MRRTHITLKFYVFMSFRLCIFLAVVVRHIYFQKIYFLVGNLFTGLLLDFVLIRSSTTAAGTSTVLSLIITSKQRACLLP